LSGVAAVAIIAGASNLAPAAADGPWQGLYFGGDIGRGEADFDGVHQGNCTFCGFSVAVGSDIDGFIGGGHFGYNHQINSYVVGVEADVLFADWEERQVSPSSSTPATGSDIIDSLDLLASIRGRLGFVPRDDILLFGTGGVAFVEAEHTIIGSGTTFGHFDLNDVGFVVGGGFEWRPDDWFSLRLQGLYYIFDESVQTGFSGIGSAAPGDFGEINGAFTILGGISFPLGRRANIVRGGHK